MMMRSYCLLPVAISMHSSPDCASSTVHVLLTFWHMCRMDMRTIGMSSAMSTFQPLGSLRRRSSGPLCCWSGVWMFSSFFESLFLMSFCTCLSSVVVWGLDLATSFGFLRCMALFMRSLHAWMLTRAALARSSDTAWPELHATTALSTTCMSLLNSRNSARATTPRCFTLASASQRDWILARSWLSPVTLAVTSSIVPMNCSSLPFALNTGRIVISFQNLVPSRR